MNILYLHTHDSGRWLEPYGHHSPTPNLMALARQSTLFRHCYCAGPTCSPSRAALLTGTAPHVNGMIGLAHRGFALKDYNMHLARYLGAQGFDTALCGIQHEAADPQTIGYDRILSERGGDNMYIPDARAYDMENAARAAEFLRGRSGEDRPFFLSFGMINTHRDFPADTGDIRQDYVQPPGVIYDNRQNREDMAGFLASAKTADQCAGIVLRALEEAGLGDNTVVLFTTDHGIAFPHMKCNLYDTGIGVAMMLRYPGNPTAGTAVDALVSHVDLFPTLCQLCGLEPPPWLEGTSLVPVLRGETEEVNGEIFSEVTYHASYEPKRAVRTQRYKLIRRYDCHGGIVPSNIDNGPSKRFLLDSGILQQGVEREQLFDLYLDPLERENLAGDGRYREVYNDLSARLCAWMERTQDPLIQVLHRVPAPAGAQVNTLDCLHAEYEQYE